MSHTVIKPALVTLVALLLATTGLGWVAWQQQQSIQKNIVEINSQTETLHGLNGRLLNLKTEIQDSQSENAIRLQTVADFLTSLKEYEERFVSLDTTIVLNQTVFEANSEQINSLNKENKTLVGAIAGTIPGIDYQKLYDQVKNSVVQISDGEHIYGTGFIVFKTGEILTAYHVIKDLSSIYVVTFQGEVLESTLKNYSSWDDVATLKIVENSGYTPVILDDWNTLAVGDYVFTVGNPLDIDNSLTVGITSQLHRMVNLGTFPHQHWITDLIQFDTAVNPGNSGGPLFDRNGRVVGMIIAGISPVAGKGMGLAVSSTRLGRIARSTPLGSPPVIPALYLGVRVAAIDIELAQSLERTTINGALVTWVKGEGMPRTNSPAGDAGILPGDIIVEVAGVTIKNPADLAAILIWHGKTVTVPLAIDVVRNSQELILYVTLGYCSELNFPFQYRREPSGLISIEM